MFFGFWLLDVWGLSISLTVVCGTVGFSAVVFRDVKPILAPQTLQTFFSDVAIKIAVLPEREKREDR